MHYHDTIIIKNPLCVYKKKRGLKTKQLTCEQARQIDLIDYLQSLGHQPSQIRLHNCWYLSPLRGEKRLLLKSTESSIYGMISGSAKVVI
jgi:hypothetical protein